ncbi:SIS domain-containing protein [Bacillus amyloliquefaciens]|uniref:SIS domain-containing protein n=1 Tax=Bacillus amyloliquefaciens TaxID=1390 RepID=UPI00200DA1BF|nr:SIS domain-containing protein [Bacillus amyloliquefaciens]
MLCAKIIQTYQDENGRLAVAGDVADAVAEADRIYIVACGTSYHAGLVGKQYIEMWANVPVEVHVASEFSTTCRFCLRSRSFIFLSQSGETAGQPRRACSSQSAGSQSADNYKRSGINAFPREADYTLLLHAGPEIAVASTKAYTAQIAVLAIVASVAAECNGVDIGFDLVKRIRYCGKRHGSPLRPEGRNGNDRT